VLVALRLDEQIEDLALRVDGPPEIDHVSVDFQIDLVEMPSRMRLQATLSQVGRDHRFVGHSHATFRQQIFDVAQAEREPEVEPNRLLNDLRREPVTRVADFLHPLGYRANQWDRKRDAA
jgi:hypothetical protein